MAKPKTKQLPVNEIEATSKTQARVRLDPQIIDEYAQVFQDGGKFPPIVVFAEKGSERYILADGFHRLQAAQKVGLENIRCEVHEGGPHEALEHALGANVEHGVRRTNADKVRVVQLALADPAYDDMSSRDLGEICRVSHTLIQMEREAMNEDDGTSRRREDKKKGNGAAGHTRSPITDPPTQQEVNHGELRQAIDMIRSFPFTGPEAIEQANVTEKDYDDLFYIAEWYDELVAAMEQAGLAGGE